MSDCSTHAYDVLLKGMLTAEQVREATYAHSIHADCADADWQAIADELNSRAERTCEVWRDGKMGRCSECRYEHHYETGWKRWSVCPNCGAKVVGE